MLEIQTLSFKHQAHYLFKNLNVQMNSGNLLQITGKNGSGKTTLLRILASLLKPSDGNIYYDNQSIYEKQSHYQAVIAYLGHTSGIKPNLTVKENLISYAILMGIKQLHINTCLEKLDLTAVMNKLAYQLSQGQQRRLALAKIVLSQKPVWILDEPLTALDAQGIDQFNTLLLEHIQAKGMAIIATHQCLNLNAISVKQLAL